MLHRCVLHLGVLSIKRHNISPPGQRTLLTCIPTVSPPLSPRSLPQPTTSRRVPAGARRGGGAAAAAVATATMTAAAIGGAATGGLLMTPPPGSSTALVAVVTTTITAGEAVVVAVVADTAGTLQLVVTPSIKPCSTARGCGSWCVLPVCCAASTSCCSQRRQRRWRHRLWAQQV